MGNAVSMRALRRVTANDNGDVALRRSSGRGGEAPVTGVGWRQRIADGLGEAVILGVIVITIHLVLNG